MTTNRDGLIEKVRALLSKTVDKGCTEEEALAALDKAHALMDAYEVTAADLQLTKEETAILRSEPPDSLDPHNIKFHLMGSVADFCSCKAWRTSKQGKAVTFCGLPSDARLATWLLDTLAAFVQAELARHLMDTLPPRGRAAQSDQRLRGRLLRSDQLSPQNSPCPICRRCHVQWARACGGQERGRHRQDEGVRHPHP
jgi:hypothetical protein